MIFCTSTKNRKNRTVYDGGIQKIICGLFLRHSVKPKTEHQEKIESNGGNGKALRLQTIVDVGKVGHLILLKYDDFCQRRTDVERTVHTVDKVLPLMSSTAHREQHVEHFHLRW